VPLVSICIPTYNTMRYLGEAVDSALGQEGLELEVVVCDDASTDGTEEYCRGIEDPRFRYISFADRGGQARNFNRCVDVARGSLLTILHADDRLLPGFVADRVGRLQRDHDLGFVFGAVERIDALGVRIGVDRRWPADRKLSRKELLEVFLLGSAVSPPSLMVRRDVALAVGPFRTDLTWGHDWQWAIRLALVSRAEYDAEPRACYRDHEGSGTAAELNAARNGAQERRILQESLERVCRFDASLVGLRRPAFRALGLRHMYFAARALMANQPQVARHNLRYAARAHRFLMLRPTFWAMYVASLTRPALYTTFLRLIGRT
jgi:glycosyltransferase involved in cell wall biosynthesis